MKYIFLGIAVVAVLLLLWYISARNSIRRSEVKVEEGESGIDVALTKRYDTLTKLLDITKAYAAHEVETLTKITELRKGMALSDKSRINSQMDEVSGRITLIGEAYPELRSSDAFVQLQITAADTEEHIQAARRLYNASVTSYNNLIVSFPSSLVASSMGAAKKPFFEAEEAKKDDVRMQF